MDIRKLQRAIVDGLEDVKAHDIVVFNTEHLSPLFERVIIATGSSNRQTKALASSVRDAVKSNGMGVLATEGESNGEWIIVDCGAAVAHIMQPAIRDYYRLEELWGGKPVRMKLGTVDTKLVKASEPEAPSAPVTAPARKGRAAPAKPAAPSKPGRGQGAATKAARVVVSKRTGLPRGTPATKAGQAAVKAAGNAAGRASGKVASTKAAPAKKSGIRAAPRRAAPAAAPRAAKRAPARKTPR